MLSGDIVSIFKQYGMKQAKKIGSFNIRDMREHSKRSSREEPNKTKSSLMSDIDKKRKTQPKFDANFELQKQFVKAENLTPQEEAKIRKQAERTVTKKAKSTEIKIENEMISMLELQCSKLGQELQMQKASNQKLKFQIVELRKNIDFLNTKLENIYRDHENLSKNNDYGKMEKDQLREELQKNKLAYQRSEEEREHQKKVFESKYSSMQEEIEELKASNRSLEANLKNIREEKEEVQEELEEKARQYEYVREQFQERKREWDRMKQEMEAQSRDTLDRKGQKITKFQVQLQNLTDKLKQQQSVRKKVIDKNKQLEKEIMRKGQIIKDMEDQINNMKKRINDLSILKSSNNAIMNQKLNQLTEENAKLKKAIDALESKKGAIIHEEQSKPFLFGPEDHD